MRKRESSGQPTRRQPGEMNGKLLQGQKGGKTHSLATIMQGLKRNSEYLGHASVETTMIYTHVVRDLRHPVQSPLDAL
jgi:integrase